jgi:RNA polymerase sigma-70 factor (ECF subfamily)
VSGLPEAAYRRHYGQVYRYLRRRTHDHDRAEELAQRVFADAAAALADLDEETPVLAWLYTVAARRFVDEARRAARIRVVELHDDVAAVEHGPSVARAIAAALAQLPGEQRDVVVAKLVAGRSFAEIARAAGASEAACKMRFLRGLERVRDLLRAEGIEP